MSKLDDSENPLSNAFATAGVSEPWLSEFKNLSPKDIAALLHTIDESPYALHEWAEAFVAFQAWSKKENRILKSQHMMEYISCCTESTRAGIKLSLPFLLQEFLKTNGVE